MFPSDTCAARCTSTPQTPQSVTNVIKYRPRVKHSPTPRKIQNRGGRFKKSKVLHRQDRVYRLRSPEPRNCRNEVSEVHQQRWLRQDPPDLRHTLDRLLHPPGRPSRSLNRRILLVLPSLVENRFAGWVRPDQVVDPRSLPVFQLPQGWLRI